MQHIELLEVFQACFHNPFTFFRVYDIRYTNFRLSSLLSNDLGGCCRLGFALVDTKNLCSLTGKLEGSRFAISKPFPFCPRADDDDCFAFQTPLHPEPSPRRVNPAISSDAYSA